MSSGQVTLCDPMWQVTLCSSETDSYEDTQLLKYQCCLCFNSRNDIGFDFGLSIETLVLFTSVATDHTSIFISRLISRKLQCIRSQGGVDENCRQYVKRLGRVANNIILGTSVSIMLSRAQQPGFAVQTDAIN